MEVNDETESIYELINDHPNFPDKTIIRIDSLSGDLEYHQNKLAITLEHCRITNKLPLIAIVGGGLCEAYNHLGRRMKEAGEILKKTFVKKNTKKTKPNKYPLPTKSELRRQQDRKQQDKLRRRIQR